MAASLQAKTMDAGSRPRWWAGAGIACALLAAGAAWLAYSDAGQDAPQAPPAAHPGPMAQGAERHTPSVAGNADTRPATRSVAQIEHALFAKGSLNGTQAPPWGVRRDETLKPTRALRDRFDYYLLALGEASLAELTALVRAHAERDLGAKTAAEVLEVWERYLRLQQHAFQVAARPDDPLSMQAALQEHSQVRQSVLGMHWAQAFYGDEERQLALDIDHKLKGVIAPKDTERSLTMAPGQGVDPAVLHQQRAARFGEEAARRLADLDRTEAEWARRIEAARARVQAMKEAPELSAPQREAAVRQYLDGAFPNPSERLRAGGLVGE